MIKGEFSLCKRTKKKIEFSPNKKIRMKMYESMGNGGFHTKKIHREVWLMRKKKVY